MPAYMNGKTGAWYVQCYYSDIDGNRKHKVKRGFATKGEALAWETEFLACADGSMSMPFEAFVKRYSEDVRPRLKLNTWHFFGSQQRGADYLQNFVFGALRMNFPA